MSSRENEEALKASINVLCSARVKVSTLMLMAMRGSVGIFDIVYVMGRKALQLETSETSSHAIKKCVGWKLSRCSSKRSRNNVH